MQSKFRQTIISPGGRVEFRYPDDTPAYRRGFTPSGGAKLHFRATKTNGNPYVIGRSGFALNANKQNFGKCVPKQEMPKPKLNNRGKNLMLRLAELLTH